MSQHDATTTPPEPNMRAVMRLLQRVLTHNGTITLTTERRVPQGYTAEADFTLNEVAFAADLDDDAWLESLATMLTHLDRGPSYTTDTEVAWEARRVQECVTDLLWGNTALQSASTARRPHLVLVES